MTFQGKPLASRIYRVFQVKNRTGEWGLRAYAEDGKGNLVKEPPKTLEFKFYYATVACSANGAIAARPKE